MGIRLIKNKLFISMKKFLLAWVGLILMSQIGFAQIVKVSLNSSNPQIAWQVKPQADLGEVKGEQISVSGFDMGNSVAGIVPGTVFTSYVEAGKEADPSYGDNIYKVDETFYNRPFWYRAEFNLPICYEDGNRVWLHFDNINRFADFYFNGTKISGTESSTKDVSGHMLRSKFDVTSLLNLNSAAF